MPLKKSHGNMYPWVTHMHSHLAGECPHKCSYCYVQKNRFGVNPKYKGESRLIESELDINYGDGKIIFIEHMNDLFAGEMPPHFITKILNHCRKYPYNEYIFQTKNPFKAHYFLFRCGVKYMLGTTIETNRFIDSISKAPAPINRYEALKECKHHRIRTFITIEPIIDFDVKILAEWILDINPKFVNIGADSKGCNLPEPSAEKILQFIAILKNNGINIKKKSNLGRLLKRKILKSK